MPPAQYGWPCPAEAATESALLVIQRVAPAYEFGRALTPVPCCTGPALDTGRLFITSSGPEALGRAPALRERCGARGCTHGPRSVGSLLGQSWGRSAAAAGLPRRGEDVRWVTGTGRDVGGAAARPAARPAEEVRVWAPAPLGCAPEPATGPVLPLPSDPCKKFLRRARLAVNVNRSEPGRVSSAVQESAFWGLRYARAKRDLHAELTPLTPRRVSQAAYDHGEQHFCELLQACHRPHLPDTQLQLARRAVAALTEASHELRRLPRGAGSFPGRRAVPRRHPQRGGGGKPAETRPTRPRLARGRGRSSSSAGLR